jgi:hypothetical protein
VKIALQNSLAASTDRASEKRAAGVGNSIKVATPKIFAAHGHRQFTGRGMKPRVGKSRRSRRKLAKTPKAHAKNALPFWGSQVGQRGPATRRARYTGKERHGQRTMSGGGSY